VPCSCKTEERKERVEEGGGEDNDTSDSHQHGGFQHGDSQSRDVGERPQNDVRSEVDNTLTARTTAPRRDNCVADKDSLPACGSCLKHA